jgi:polyhydroxyalkanoate synthesis repressor PhaR
MPSSRRGSSSSTPDPACPGVRILKKYPNRRLYDSQSSSYVTLADVKAMVLSREAFEVRDAKTGEDLTRSILLQILLEEESAGVPLFSTDLLAQLIRFYGQASQGLMAPFLEASLKNFADLQARLGETSRGLYTGGSLPADAWSQMMAGQNIWAQGLWERYLEQSQALLAQMPGVPKASE